MSLNYRESSGAATSWRRANNVVITNPLNNILAATVSFGEEDVIQKGSFVVTTPAGGVSANFDPSGTFAVINPETGLPTGQNMTHSELYVILYSLYIKLATERDNAVGN